MTVVDDLKAAKAELIRRGRCTGSTMDDKGRVCMVGAVAAAVAPALLGRAAWEVCEIPRSAAAVKELNKHVYDVDVFEGCWAEYRVAGFNDRTGRTTEDVLGVFDKAIADLGGMV